MPIEIHDMEIINEPAPKAASSSPAATASPTPSPTEPGEQLRRRHRELADRASRIRAD